MLESHSKNISQVLFCEFYNLFFQFSEKIFNILKDIKNIGLKKQEGFTENYHQLERNN